MESAGAVEGGKLTVFYVEIGQFEKINSSIDFTAYHIYTNTT